MAKYCINCGNPLSEGDAFCDSCGARVDAGHDGQTVQLPQPSQPPAQEQAQEGAPASGQPYAQPATQQYYAQPATQQPYEQSSAGQYGYAAPGQEPGRRGPKPVLIAAIAVLATAALALVIFAVVRLSRHRDEPAPPEETRIETPAATPAEPLTAPFPATPSEPPVQTPEEAPVEEAPAEVPQELPYANGLGSPSASDFIWIADAQGGNLSGSFLGTDDLVGTWKGEIVYDGAWELAYVTIYRDASIVIEPYQINYGDGWVDEAGEESYVFSGAFDISSVNGAGTYGSINLYTFLESYGTQYAVGTFSVNNASSADVYLVRP